MKKQSESEPLFVCAMVVGSYFVVKYFWIPIYLWWPF